METEQETGQESGNEVEIPAKLSDFTAKWIGRIEGASKEEESWRKTGKDICTTYTPKDAGAASTYNVLYSNTDTLLPTLYSNTPKPDVRRRFSEADPVAKFASRAIERVLSYQLSEYDFDYQCELVVLDALLVGRGIAKVKYTPIMGYNNVEGQQFEQLENEYAECEYVKWEDFRRSCGKVWSDVTWVSFRGYLTKEEAAKEFGKELADKLDYNFVANESSDEKKYQGQSNRAAIWEIWDKTSGKVIYIAESFKEMPLKVEVPTVKFRGFFPIPRPMQFILRTDSLIPMPEYQEYKKQAEQLVSISKKINDITDALLVRGIYDSTMTELARLLDAGNNEMIPADNVASMYEKGGIDKMVWMMPLNDLAAVLQYLYQQRESVKAVIFEISGVSDVLRGATKASETLGAQQMKAQYANTRLKRRQKEVQRFIRDLLRLKSEVIAENFQPETIAKISQINAAELQAAGVAPEQVVEVLQNNTIRDYRIDVQSDSMVALQDRDSQEQTAAFLQAINQFFAMIQPLVQAGVMPIETAKQVLISVSRKFKMGEDFESAIEAMKEPEPDTAEKDAEEAKLALENKRIDLDSEKNIAETSIKAAKLMMERKDGEV